MSQDGDALIICDGGLASLVACTMAAKRNESRAEQTGTIVWFVPAGDDSDPAKRNALRAISTLLGLSFGESKVEQLSGDTPSRRETSVLLECAAQAMAQGIQTVTWAVHMGGSEPDAWPDLDEIAERMDRALMCARLASLDGQTDQAGELRILTPLIDLTDRQLAELAADLAVAIETCWWHGAGENEQAVQEARRWGELLGAAGVGSSVA